MFNLSTTVYVATNDLHKYTQISYNTYFIIIHELSSHADVEDNSLLSVIMSENLEVFEINTKKDRRKATVRVKLSVFTPRKFQYLQQIFWQTF